MMPTCQAQMLNNRKLSRSAFTLTELMVVLCLMVLFISMAAPNLLGLYRKNTFKSCAEELISTIQMAANSAAQSDNRYEIIIDITEQNYTFRQITSNNLSDVLEEEIIAKRNFTKNCRAAYVIFDDGDYTYEGQAKFRVGHSGWQFGGKIVLWDDKDQPYSIIINRLNKNIVLKPGDVSFLSPRGQDEIQF
jgi:Tfp pilus assembly protein FimT